MAGGGERWRPHVLRDEFPRYVPPRRHLRGQDPERRQARRSPDRAADDVRAGPQPQDRQGARPDAPPVAAPAGGSGDRVMDRRTFMCSVTLGLLAAPLAAEAQPAPGKVYHVGLLSIGSDPTWRIPWKPFVDAMSELGYVEGRNILIRPAFADGNPERLPALVAELVGA